jgi:hypothetical protein
MTLSIVRAGLAVTMASSWLSFLNAKEKSFFEVDLMQKRQMRCLN